MPDYPYQYKPDQLQVSGSPCATRVSACSSDTPKFDGLAPAQRYLQYFNTKLRSFQGG